MRPARKIVNAIQVILNEVKDQLLPEDVTNARELLEHNEWGLALSLICDQLYESGLPINQTTYDKIAALSEEMGLPPHEWKFLEEFVIHSR